jgi:hypothetical protein
MFASPEGGFGEAEVRRDRRGGRAQESTTRVPDGGSGVKGRAFFLSETAARGYSLAGKERRTFGKLLKKYGIDKRRYHS